MYRITGDSFTVFGDAVGDDAGNFEVAHADVPASGADHSIQMVCSVACHCIAVVLPSAIAAYDYDRAGWYQLRQ
jgi:hypothetical protein